MFTCTEDTGHHQGQVEWLLLVSCFVKQSSQSRKGAEMISQHTFWRKSSKLTAFHRTHMEWAKARRELGVTSITMCESILWQFCLSRGIADKKKLHIPILHGVNRGQLPTPSHKQVASTKSMAGNFLFLTLISTFIPPGSNSRAITGLLQLFMSHSVPAQWPQRQQTGNNTVISSLCHD